MLGIFLSDRSLNRSNESSSSLQGVFGLRPGSKRIGFVEEKIPFAPHPLEAFYQIDVILAQKMVRELHDRPMLGSIGREVSLGEEE